MTGKIGKKGQQVVLREAIGKIVTLPQALAFPIISTINQGI